MRLQIGHQRERAVVAHDDAIDVGDRQRKPARCNRLPKSRRSANGATRGDTPPSSSASAAAKDCRNSVSVSPPIIAASNSPSGLQRAADLRQHAGQVVDELKGERGNGEIERFRLAGQRLGLAVRQIDPRELIDAPGQRVADLIARRCRHRPRC